MSGKSFISLSTNGSKGKKMTRKKEAFGLDIRVRPKIFKPVKAKWAKYRNSNKKYMSFFFCKC
jgi:hypothetical protein